MTDEKRQAGQEGQATDPLRSRAEALLERMPQPAPEASASESDALRLLHELQVHHVELQLQNEELEQARADALAARDRYARLFDLAPVAVFNLARDGRIVDANRAAATLLREAPGALRQRRLQDFFAPESEPVWQALLDRAEAPEHHGADLRLKRADATPCSVQAELAFDREAPSLLVTLTDVTERERAEQLQRAAVLALERAARLKNEFLSQMSHELRTPLNAVLGFSHLQLADTLTPLSPANRQRAEQVQRAGQHLLSLIEDALDIASIESGHVAVSIEPVGVTSAVAECLLMIEPQARTLGLRVSGPAATPSSGRAELLALADARRFRQVLLNLLSNAVKYNRPGGEVRVSCRAETQPDRVTVIVTDTGQGIGEQQQQRLFRPYERLGAERTGVEGSGLGLMITRLLVQAMGGTLQIASEAGLGTVVSVSLPAAPEGALAAAGSATAQAATIAAPTPARVLYIEADPGSRTLMGGVVAGIEGASLVVAPDGLSGLAQARQLQPAVVIVDLELPDIDGVSVLRALRQSPATRDCRCVAVSTDASTHARAELLDAGFDEFWPKPSSVGFMRERLAALLHRS